MNWKQRVEIRQELKKRFPDISKNVLKHPRKCSKCGCIETLDNIMLKFDGLVLCDDCLPSDISCDDKPF